MNLLAGLRREGDRVEPGVKTRYENPAPDFTGDGAQRLKDIVQQSVGLNRGETLRFLWWVWDQSNSWAIL